MFISLSYKANFVRGLVEFIKNHMGSHLLTQFNLNPIMIINYIHNKVWYEMTYPFPIFNGCAVEVWEWISNLNLLHMWLLIQAGI